MCEVGFCFVGAFLILGEGIPGNVYVAVADFAVPLVPRFFIMGTVTEDSDATVASRMVKDLTGSLSAGGLPAIRGVSAAPGGWRL